MDLRETCKKLSAIDASYRGAGGKVSVSYLIEDGKYQAACPPKFGHSQTSAEDAVRNLTLTMIESCKGRIGELQASIAFEESMIGELEGLL